jgi:hypothetical protein
MIMHFPKLQALIEAKADDGVSYSVVATVTGLKDLKDAHSMAFDMFSYELEDIGARVDGATRTKGGELVLDVKFDDPVTRGNAAKVKKAIISSVKNLDEDDPNYKSKINVMVE